MNPDDKINITTASDQEQIGRFATMMSVSDPWNMLGMDYQQCRLSFDGPCREVYSVSYNSDEAGFVILQTCGSFKGYIQTLFVKEEFRSRGLGKKLLEFSEQRILAISPNVFICVSAFNEGAIKLYYRFGFKLVGELTDFVKMGFTELLLRKTVGPISGYKKQ